MNPLEEWEFLEKLGSILNKETMAKIQISIYVGCLACSVILNVLLLSNYVYVGGKGQLSWSRRAAEEAEAVAAVSCSGHGRGYLDGLVVDGSPVCECNSCFGGPDCSQFAPDCVADADRYVYKSLSPTPKF